MTDHKRPCQGREYTCSCGWDEENAASATKAADALERQAAEIERLRKALWPFAQVKPTAAKGFVNICALNVDVIEAQAALTGEDA